MNNIDKIADLITEDPDLINEINNNGNPIQPEDMPERFMQGNLQKAPSRFSDGPPPPLETEHADEGINDQMFLDAVDALILNGYRPVKRNQAMQIWTMGGYTITVTFHGRVKILTPEGNAIYTVKLSELPTWLQEEHP